MKTLDNNNDLLASPRISSPQSKEDARTKERSQHRRRSRVAADACRDIAVAPREDCSRKFVTFAPIIRFKTVKHINDYSEREIKATWYTEEDLEDVIAECITTVRKMVKKEGFDERVFCERGLEYKTPSGAKFRKKNKVSSIQIVIDEQRLQKSMGMEDPEYLAEIYSDACKNSKRLAHLMAVRDAKDVGPLTETRSPTPMMMRKRAAKKNSSITSSPTSITNFPGTRPRVVRFSG